LGQQQALGRGQGPEVGLESRGGAVIRHQAAMGAEPGGLRAVANPV